MNKMKLQPEQIVMTVVLVLFGAGAAFLAMYLPVGEELVPQTAGKAPEKIPLEKFEVLGGRMKQPVAISGVKEEQPVFVSRVIVYYPANGAIEPLDKNKELPGVGITAAWLIKNNLSIEDTEVGTQDPDSDGFNNVEEYKGSTNPQDKNSHPGIIAKLRGKKFNPIAFNIEFKGRVQGADGLQFQISFKNRSKLYRKGDIIEDYEIGLYREKIEERFDKGTNTTYKDDVSELDITFKKLNETVTLVLNKKQESNESTMEFVLQVPGGKVEPSTVKRGDTFKVRDRTYQLLKAGNDGAVIRDVDDKQPENKITVPMMR